MPTSIPFNHPKNHSKGCALFLNKAAIKESPVDLYHINEAHISIMVLVITLHPLRSALRDLVNWPAN